VIRRILDLSTQHLPPDLRQDRLTALPGVVAYQLTHGWLLWVPHDPDDSARLMDEPVPEPVLEIQRYARRKRCDYVLFDADGHTDPALPTWDW
jgi:hypothetical protein